MLSPWKAHTPLSHHTWGLGLSLTLLADVVPLCASAALQRAPDEYCEPTLSSSTIPSTLAGWMLLVPLTRGWASSVPAFFNNTGRLHKLSLLQRELVSPPSRPFYYILEQRSQIRSSGLLKPILSNTWQGPHSAWL